MPDLQRQYFRCKTGIKHLSNISHVVLGQELLSVRSVCFFLYRKICIIILPLFPAALTVYVKHTAHDQGVQCKILYLNCGEEVFCASQNLHIAPSHAPPRIRLGYSLIIRGGFRDTSSEKWTSPWCNFTRFYLVLKRYLILRFLQKYIMSKNDCFTLYV